MVKGARRAAWNHTASLLCLQVNLNRAKGKRVRQVKEFHPYWEEGPKRAATKAELHFFKQYFTHRKKNADEKKVKRGGKK